ncbi:hypothetical protein L7F22_021262 [Adiantum nelumboides]|nr:hypothetical protein [Adiantum nelumboides]
MTYHGEWFVDRKEKLEEDEFVATGDDTMHRITHVGSVPLLEKDGTYNTLRDVLYVPSITKNLASVGQMTDQGLQVRFNHYGCFTEEFHKGRAGKILARERKKGRLFSLKVGDPCLHSEDDYRRMTWVCFLKAKLEAFEVFLEFKVMVEKENGCHIKCLCTDGGGEYMSHSFDDYLREQGIRRQITCRYTPQQNGVAERKNRVIAEIARAMMNEMNMPLTYWAEAVHTIVHITNRTPTAATHEISPYERLYGIKPTVSYMRVFGCVRYVHVPNEARKKMEPKAMKCIFLGYPVEKKGYKCYDPTTRKVMSVEMSDFKQDEKGKKKVFEESSRDESFDEEHGLPHLRTPGSKYAEKYVPPYARVEEKSVPQLRRSKKSLHVFKRQLENQNGSQQWMMDALVKNETWDLVCLPSGKKEIGSKWVYKVKCKSDGSVERYKARLVAKGYAQTKGLHYDETFSPVAKMTTIRLVIAMANMLGVGTLSAKFGVTLKG